MHGGLGVGAHRTDQDDVELAHGARAVTGSGRPSASGLPVFRRGMFLRLSRYFVGLGPALLNILGITEHPTAASVTQLARSFLADVSERVDRYADFTSADIKIKKSAPQTPRVDERRLRSVEVHPVCRGPDNDVRPLVGDEARSVLDRVAALSAPFGTAAFDPATDAEVLVTLPQASYSPS
jgi:hypothetical protein